MHKIRQVELDFDCSDVRAAQWFQQLGEQLFLTALLPRTEQIFDDYVGPLDDIEVNLQELTVQVPPFDPAKDCHQWLDQFEQALRAALPIRWQQKPSSTASPFDEPEQAIWLQLDSLIYGSATSLHKHWEALLAQGKLLVQQLRILGRRRSDLGHRLAAQLSPAMGQQLLAMLAPGEDQFILALFEGAAKEEPNTTETVPLTFQQRLLWQLSFSYLLNDRGSEFNRKSFLNTLLSQLARHENQDAGTLRRVMKTKLLALRERSTLFNQLYLLLDEASSPPVVDVSLPALKSQQHAPLELYMALQSQLSKAGHPQSDILKALVTLKEQAPWLARILVREYQSGYWRLSAGLNTQHLRQWLTWLMQMQAITPALHQAIEQQAKQHTSPTEFYLAVLESVQKGGLLDLQKIASLAHAPHRHAQAATQAEPALKTLSSHLSSRLCWQRYVKALQEGNPAQAQELQNYLFQHHLPWFCSKLKEALKDKTLRTQWIDAHPDPCLDRHCRAIYQSNYINTLALATVLSDSVNGLSLNAKDYRQVKWWVAIFLANHVDIAPQKLAAKLLEQLISLQSIAKGDPDKSLARHLAIQLALSIPHISQRKLKKQVDAIKNELHAPYAGDNIPHVLWSPINWQFGLYEQICTNLSRTTAPDSQLCSWLRQLIQCRPLCLRLLRQLQAGHFPHHQSLAYWQAPELHALLELLMLSQPGQRQEQLSAAMAPHTLAPTRTWRILIQSLLDGSPITPLNLESPLAESGKDQTESERTWPAQTAEASILPDNDGVVMSVADRIKLTRHLSSKKSLTNADLPALCEALAQDLKGNNGKVEIAWFTQLGDTKLRADLIRLLIDELPEERLCRLLSTLSRAHGGHILDIVESLTIAVLGLRREQLPALFTEPRQYKQFKWQVALEHALHEQPQDYAALVQRLLDRFSLAQSRTSATSIPQGLLQALAQQLTLGLLPQSRPASVFLLQQLSTLSNQRSLPIRQKVIQDESVQVVEHAGLVLLSPYLGRLFNLLGLTEQGLFKDRRAAGMACLTLDYLALGRIRALTFEQFPSLQLTMLLCAVTPPLADNLSLGEAERGIADEMLAALLTHWPNMANSSVSTLRETFMQRSGLLSKQDNSWRLQVEKRPFDMLLDSLPWSYSIIRLPWMKETINVQWR
ncbi:contractile injection system tape measure protein [Aliiglaciecola sp. CAU 1673]|uniref:contractile injection system tape measure protein n=1 Tax=Aliiglaciecola sp. CAU 1673 TaxID=3032595 RepID=UPI0023DC9159|nr:contractile injection system tape measure protein [Aliiglaciecola sp. CAU 1673]MDF2177184.1 contractile injection system tape measure protein [Aliiglaciecola sp. CAU 1673]